MWVVCESVCAVCVACGVHGVCGVCVVWRVHGVRMFTQYERKSHVDQMVNKACLMHISSTNLVWTKRW